MGRDNAVDKLWHNSELGKVALDTYLEEIGQMDKKVECLHVYREHVPNISLYEGVKDLLNN